MGAGVNTMRREFETFLARLYTDETLRARFLADPSGEGERNGLTSTECADLACIDRLGLQMMAKSLKAKSQKAKDNL
jgi:hypothetical protein